MLGSTYDQAACLRDTITIPAELFSDMRMEVTMYGSGCRGSLYLKKPCTCRWCRTIAEIEKLRPSNEMAKVGSAGKVGS